MAFVVEDGNGLPLANAYVAVAYADAYFLDRAVTEWAGTDAVKQAAIIKATDYIDTVWGPKFLGAKAFVSNPPDPAIDQMLEFPRDNRVGWVGNPSYYSDVQYFGPITFVGSQLTKPVVIPDQLKKACCEYALRALLNGKLLLDPTVDASGLQVASKTEVVGPITETTSFYNVGGISVTQPYPAADLLLRKLIRPPGVIRG